LPSGLKYLKLEKVPLDKGHQSINQLPKCLWGLELLDAGVHVLGDENIKALPNLQYLEVVTKSRKHKLQKKIPLPMDKETCQCKIENAFWNPDRQNVW
jgi:hypothetical protein